VVGAEPVARSTPDGTSLLYGNEVLTVLPSLGATSPSTCARISS
jgi:hypothetical protein